MDIIKSILHVFKKSDNAFKIMHPETESAQVTDWNQGIVNTLASTGLSSLVNVLSSDSLLALLIKKVFDATGVKYSLGQNGYVCFGSLVGGLIIQWVSGIVPTNYEIFGIAYPIAFTRFCMPIICHSTNSKTDFKQLSVNNSSSMLTQLVVQEKNKQEAGIYAIIIGY